MRSLLVRIIVAVFAVTIVACGSSVKVGSDGSLTGTLTTGQLPDVSIDGKPMRLAPGARIYNQSNLTITPNQVPANARVRYKTDSSGQITQVWLLPAER